MNELVEQLGRQAVRARELERRARLSAELAERALDGSERTASGPSDALACELYRQSIYWATQSLALARSGADDLDTAGAATADELEASWSSAGLREPSLDEGELALLERARGTISGKTFVDFAAASVEEQARTASELRQAAAALLRAAPTTRQEIDALWLQRLLRVGAIGLGFAALALGLVVATTSSDERQDLAAGRPWRASSAYPAASCSSPAQACSQSPDYFFHTEEEDRPWLELDLGKLQHISAVSVENRKDCCGDRAVPLLIEVGTDRERFKQVARKDEAFDSWKATFGPLPARYVRVRAARRTMLHLARVRVPAP
jgi:hypothetical protein